MMVKVMKKKMKMMRAEAYILEPASALALSSLLPSTSFVLLLFRFVACLPT